MERLFQPLQTSQSERFPNIQATSFSTHFHFIPPHLSHRPCGKKINEINHSLLSKATLPWELKEKKKKKEYILNGTGWAVNVIRGHGYLR